MTLGPENPRPAPPVPSRYEFQKASKALTYGTPIARVTDNKVGGTAGAKYMRSDYSRRQAFNADSSKFLMNRRDGYWFLYDSKTLKQDGDALPGLAADCEPIWHQTDPDILWYVPNNGWGAKLHELNVKTRTLVKTWDLLPRLKAIWPTANSMWSKSEGSPSLDGRYWCWLVQDSSYKILGILTYDRVEDKILGHFSTDKMPDHTSMSPSGEWATVSWAYNKPLGTRAYTRNLTDPHPASPEGNPYIQVHKDSEHSDLGLLANGEDVYVSVDYDTPGGTLSYTSLKTGQKVPLLDLYAGSTGTAYHVSCRCWKVPGYAVVSTYDEYHNDNRSKNLRDDPRLKWFHRKVLVVELKPGGRIWPIAWADSDRRDAWAKPGGNYWAEPQATVNPDLTRILFNSTMASEDYLDVETYMLALPPATFPK